MIEIDDAERKRLISLRERVIAAGKTEFLPLVDAALSGKEIQYKAKNEHDRQFTTDITFDPLRYSSFLYRIHPDDAEPETPQWNPNTGVTFDVLANLLSLCAHRLMEVDGVISQHCFRALDQIRNRS